MDVELGKRAIAKGPRWEAVYLLKFRRLNNGSAPKLNHYTCAPGNDTFLTLRSVFWKGMDWKHRGFHIPDHEFPSSAIV